MTGRGEVLSRLAAALLGRRVAHTLRVAVDGPDAAGKTWLADDLAKLLAADRPVIRASVDSFHRPAADRLRRGSLSPEGYYLDSFDHDAVVRALLRPLGPGGDGRYVPARYDHRTETAAPEVERRAEPGSVLLFDGVFLLRPELRAHWDVAVYLHVEPEETLRRARERDRELFGSTDVVEERYRARYLPGQALYRASAQPLERADIVLDLTDPGEPGVLRWSVPD